MHLFRSDEYRRLHVAKGCCLSSRARVIVSRTDTPPSKTLLLRSEQIYLIGLCASRLVPDCDLTIPQLYKRLGGIIVRPLRHAMTRSFIIFEVDLLDRCRDLATHPFEVRFSVITLGRANESLLLGIGRLVRNCFYLNSALRDQLSHCVIGIKEHE